MNSQTIISRVMLGKLLIVGALLAMTSCRHHAVIPPRTIASAQSEYQDSKLIVGQSTIKDIETLLGSPAEIRKKANGNKIYVYVKNKYTKGASVDVGTTYVAEMTFGLDDKLQDKNYRALPMSNPLIH